MKARKALIASLVLCALAPACTVNPALDEPIGERADAVVDPATVVAVLKLAASLYAEKAGKDKARAELQKMKAEIIAAIETAKNQILQVVWDISTQNKVDAANAFLRDFQQVASWSDIDFAVHAPQGTAAVVGLESTIATAPPEQAIKAIDTLNLLAPAALIVKMANGWNPDTTSSTDLTSLFDTNELFLQTAYPSYLRDQMTGYDHKIVGEILTVNGFTVMSSLRPEFTANDYIWHVVAPMDLPFRRVEAVQVELGPAVRKTRAPRAQLKGDFGAATGTGTGWIGHFDGEGGYCHWPSLDAMTAAGATANFGISVAAAYLDTPGLINKGECPYPKSCGAQISGSTWEECKVSGAQVLFTTYRCDDGVRRFVSQRRDRNLRVCQGGSGSEL